MSAEEELARLERQVLGGKRVAAFLAAVDALRIALASDDPGIRERVLKLTAPAIGRDLAAAVVAAYEIGAADADALILATIELPDVEVPREHIDAALAAQRSIAGEVVKAWKLAAAGPAIDVEVMLAPLFGAQNMLRRDVATLINGAGNAGSTAVADAAGVPTVWVAETNACVECLAYSGRVAEPGEQFEGGLTYAAKSYNPDAIDAPPRHPHCRCTVEPLNDQSYADALRREADRSVLRGFSLVSEPMGRRIDAARRLLDDPDLVAPKSVIAYARRAVKAGEFPTRGR